jgi:hypothetical protein
MSDKTFSETQGHAPFDWNRWLDRAVLKNPSSDEFQMAYGKANQWVTCAVGNQCTIIPRYLHDGSGGEPQDRELRNLGMRFMHNIQNGEWGSAKYTLLQIEQRSAVLIEGELGKLNKGLNDPGPVVS